MQRRPPSESLDPFLVGLEGLLVGFFGELEPDEEPGQDRERDHDEGRQRHAEGHGDESKGLHGSASLLCAGFARFRFARTAFHEPVIRSISPSSLTRRWAAWYVTPATSVTSAPVSSNATTISPGCGVACPASCAKSEPAPPTDEMLPGNRA